MDKAEQLMIEHTEWATSVFGKRTFDIDLRKVKSEIEEVILSGGDIEEFVDVLLAFLSACSSAGIHYDALISAAYKKLAINKNRAWKENADGTFSHV